jgi:dihydrofolate reductase
MKESIRLAGKPVRTMVEFAGIWRDKPKIVLSRTLERAAWNTTVVPALVPEEIQALKAQPGGDLALGGADLAAAFMRADPPDAGHDAAKPH